MDYETMIQHMEAEYGDALRQMPLPSGLEEHLRGRMAAGDVEGVKLMLKVAWIVGTQAGHAAAEQARVAAVPRTRVQA